MLGIINEEVVVAVYRTVHLGDRGQQGLQVGEERHREK
jgi:hypothetical protein